MRNLVICALFVAYPRFAAWFLCFLEERGSISTHWVEVLRESNRSNAWLDNAKVPLWVRRRCPYIFPRPYPPSFVSWRDPSREPWVCPWYAPYFESEKKKKIWFLIWEMILLHWLAKIKEMAVGGATSGILYSLLPKVIIMLQGLDSYTTWCFHKYGWPNNTSQTSRGATSHNTSSVKGLMLQGRWHCWLMQRSRP